MEFDTRIQKKKSYGTRSDYMKDLAEFRYTSLSNCQKQLRLNGDHVYYHALNGLFMDVYKHCAEGHNIDYDPSIIY